MSARNMSRIRPPARLFGALEPLRAAGEFGSLLASWPVLDAAPRGDRDVVVLPGFTAGDGSTLPLRRFLANRGHRAHPWTLGRNLGFGAVGHLLDDLLDAACERAGGPVALVGWSLGGVMARRLAKRWPERVSALVMLGSPITGSPTHTAVWRTWQRLSTQDARERRALEEEIEARFRRPELIDPPVGVPTTAIYSRSDGVVPWEIAREFPGPLVENVEVRASHLGLGLHPAVLYVVADRLSRDPEHWQRFVPPRILRSIVRVAD